MAPERDLQQREEVIGLRLKAVEDIWPKNDVCWRSLVGVPCRFGISGSGSTSVEDVDAPIKVPGEDMPCGYVGRH